jgi:hypothetical protein
VTCHAELDAVTDALFQESPQQPLEAGVRLHFSGEDRQRQPATCRVHSFERQVGAFDEPNTQVRKALCCARTGKREDGLEVRVGVREIGLKHDARPNFGTARRRKRP